MTNDLLWIIIETLLSSYSVDVHLSPGGGFGNMRLVAQ